MHKEGPRRSIDSGRTDMSAVNVALVRHANCTAMRGRLLSIFAGGIQFRYAVENYTGRFDFKMVLLVDLRYNIFELFGLKK